MLRETLLEGKSTLIIEDNGTMSGVLASMVRSLGGRNVDIAVTFDTAVSYCELNSYDVMLVDIQLDRGKDGIALVKAMKERGWDKGAVTIFVTGMIARGAIEKAMELEPDGYIAKPLSAAGLCRVISKALLRRERSSILLEPGQPSTATSDSEVAPEDVSEEVSAET